MKKYFTSESVTEGHPDKICDLISDKILDEYLALDKFSKVACETLVGKDTVFVTGEITSNAKVDIEKIVRDTLKSIGYLSKEIGIDYKTCKVIVNISKQSKDIKMGVEKSKNNSSDYEYGAGDQGMVFGYACDETDVFMPMPIYLAHKMSKQLADVRKNGKLSYLRPDGKTQVTVEYDDGVPKRVDTIVVSCQHDESVDLAILKKDVKKCVIEKVIPKNLLDSNTKYYINPTGRFVIGGPMGDSGLTGRKTMVDTYGGYSRHGGGAFSGKDPSKVDRSGAYMARFIAKNIVANGYAKKCEIQISYAIGVIEPISIYIDTFETNTIPEEEIASIVNNKFDLTPRGMINTLDLYNPIYTQTTNYGHFGKEGLPWEKIIKI